MEEHSGHRQRLRESFLALGAKAMPEHQLLELLLTYAIPRRDVNPLAHRLIERYGSLAAVLKADVAELKNAGLGEYAATLIALAGAMRNISEKPRKKQRLNNPERAEAHTRGHGFKRNDRPKHSLSAHNCRMCAAPCGGIRNALP